MIGTTAVLLGRTAIDSPWAAAILLASPLLLLRWNVHPAVVVLSAALLGLLRLVVSAG